MPLESGRTIISIGAFPGLRKDWPKDVFVHEEAVYAAQQLSSFFSSVRVEHAYVLDTDPGADQVPLLEICIGGPGVNKRTADYVRSFCQPLLASSPKHDAVIVKITRPLAPSRGSRGIVLLYGNVAFDTKAAIWYFCRNFFALIRRELRVPNNVLYLKTHKDVGVHATELVGTSAGASS
ncbi:MAG TPA: hypothetical protein VFX98_05495 [Longimicrobiaceae bacterium]|nr:hypothetical protein [Longimicrobiaceae bacterium]